MLQAAQSQDFGTLRAVVEVYRQPSSPVIIMTTTICRLLMCCRNFGMPKNARRCTLPVKVRKRSNKKIIIKMIGKILWSKYLSGYSISHHIRVKTRRYRNSCASRTVPLMMAAQSGRARGVRAFIEANQGTSGETKNILEVYCQLETKRTIPPCRPKRRHLLLLLMTLQRLYTVMLWSKKPSRMCRRYCCNETGRRHN
jgi:hypothetical protein